MERYVFLFKRQQYEYLTKSVALAAGALLLTAAATAVGLLFVEDEIGASVFGGTFAWLLFFVPALTVRYQHFICGRIPFRLFLHRVCLWLPCISRLSLRLLFVPYQHSLSLFLIVLP